MNKYEITIDIMLELETSFALSSITIQEIACNSNNAIAKVMLNFMDTSFIKFATEYDNFESWEFVRIRKVKLIK